MDRREPCDFRTRLIASRGHEVHKLKARDTTGAWAYYFVHVPVAKEKVFLAAIKGNGTLNLEHYGTVIGSCYGEEPTKALCGELKRKFGFDV